MNMKRLTAVLAAVCLVAVTLSAQQTPREKYLERYNNLTSKLGAAGVGVETVLNKWSQDYPEDVDMLLGKFLFYLSKSRTDTVMKIDSDRYLGNAPVLTMKDSLDNPVNFFQGVNYDDELFGKSEQAIDKAIELNQDRLDLRLYKISALTEYEKDSPDMALSSLKALVDYNASSHPIWEYPGVEMTDEAFAATIQEYCYSFYRIGTPGGFEAFRELSEKMLTYYPNDPVYLSNIGSYHFVYKHDNKTALKFYNKVFKKNPDDYTAIKNCVLLARTEKNVKLEKKYLPMLVRVTEDPDEKASAEARLKAL